MGGSGRRMKLSLGSCKRRLDGTGATIGVRENRQRDQIATVGGGRTAALAAGSNG